jgi:hypothetical protein
VALLVTLLVLMALAMLVAQVQTSATLSYRQAKTRTYVHECRRALDSVPGLVQQIFAAPAASVQADTLLDEWNFPKAFLINLGDTDSPRVVMIAIQIQDADRKYDLTPLLATDPDTLQTNTTNFLTFTASFGLDAAVSTDLVNAIVTQAKLKFTEDQIFVTQPTTTNAGPANQPAGTSTPMPAPATSLVQPPTANFQPVWLEDYLDLPGLTAKDIAAIQAAYSEYDDPVTGDTVHTRFVDQVTTWSSSAGTGGIPNVNTASREVLLSSPTLGGQANEVDQILQARAQKPITNMSQLVTLAGVSTTDSRQLRKELGVTSTNFIVHATAVYAPLAKMPPLDPLAPVLVVPVLKKIPFLPFGSTAVSATAAMSGSAAAKASAAAAEAEATADKGPVYAARLTMVVQRTGKGDLTILWRRLEP